jgi:isopenicillin-N epimerase
MKQHFLLDPTITFLNHGSYGACPREVIEVQRRWQDEMERNPVEFQGRRSASLLREARAALASYLGASAEELVFVPNATTGVNVVARSLALQAGDEVLTTDLEYGACIETWEQVCRSAGATLRRVQIPLPLDSVGFVQRMFEQVNERTRLIFLSHITSATALILPVAALCKQARAHGILTLIDGAHAPSQVDLDLDAIGADFYTGNCHKWLCAPKAAAFLHAREHHHASLHASVISWGYLARPGQAADRDGFTGSSVFERRLQWQGTRDISAFLAVPAAIEFQRRHDWPAQRARCHAMATTLMHRLSDRFGLPPIAADADLAQMAPIPVPHADAGALRRELFDTHRIEVPVTSHAGQNFVRVSVQVYNTDGDLARLAEVLR